MFRLRYLTLLVATVCCGQQAYRHPNGIFSARLPSGWKVETTSEAEAIFEGGGALTAVRYVAASNAETVARAKDKILGFCAARRLLRTGPAQVAGVSASAEIYSGTSERGEHLIVRLVTVAGGTGALLVLAVAPEAEWDRWKADFGVIEHGLSWGGGSGPQTGAPAQRAAAPAARRDIPNGFRLAGHSGQTGQVLTASLAGGNSARAVFRTAYRLASPYFDRPPEIVSAIVDPHDRVVQAVLHGYWQGVAVTGLMTAGTDGASGNASVVFDSREQFAHSFPQLSKQLATAVPRTQAPARTTAASRPHPPQPLTQTQLPDGSGTVGLPAGWRITGAYQGCFDASGPDGSIASLGGSMIAFINPLPGTPANAITGPYRDPVRALPAMWDYSVAQGALRSGQATIQIIESAPVATQQGQAAYISFRVYNRQTDGRYLALVQTSPVDDVEWMAYMSVVGAPTNRFAEMLPTLWEIWKSWSVNPAVFKARMDAALQSMRDTFAIMQGAIEYRQRVGEAYAEAWDQVIREVSTVQNLSTGQMYQLNNSTVNLLQQLGLQNTGYRIVSPLELTGNG